MSEKQAEEISKHIDHLLAVRKHGTGRDEATTAWLQNADKKLVAKLHAYGLCEAVHNPTVAEFVGEFIERKKATAKPGTIFLCEQVQKQLGEFFPADKRIGEVTPADAKRHWHWLLTSKGLADNTARRRLGRVREIFNDAVEQEVITRNPFVQKSLPVAVGVADKHYVESTTIEEIIDHCTDLEWKLLFAFGRFIGCRMPSEIRNLKWADVNWERNTILLRSPKTEGKGKASRLVPIFPQIAPLLSRRFDSAPEGEIYVFPRLRLHTNTATTATKFVEAAGFAVWPKFWNSLRASCETDLMDEHGLRKACQWIGNSPMIAMKHYALMKQTDFVDAGNQGRIRVSEGHNTESGAVACFGGKEVLETVGESGAKSGADRGENKGTRDDTGSEIPEKSAISERKTTRHGLEP